MIDFTCPHCSRVLHIDEKYLGQSGNCNHCGNKITITVVPPPVPEDHIDNGVSPFPATITADTVNDWVSEHLARGVPLGALISVMSEMRTSLRPGNHDKRRPITSAINTMFSEMVARNLEGQALEKVKREEEARLLYEENLSDLFDGSGPYERLRVIYSRRKDYDSAIRACEAFIRITDVDEKREKFQEQLVKLHAKKEAKK